MPLLISDANILIDMDCGGLLHRMFELAHDFAVLDVLFEEELREQHPELPGLGLGVISLDEVGVADGEQLSNEYSNNGASRIDLLSLALARQQNCPLLTGDRRLREICDEIGHPVNGTLWLMGELHAAGQIDHDQAKAAYESMKDQGRRLPWPEVDRQLRRMR